jgi:hypothetical protein
MQRFSFRENGVEPRTIERVLETETPEAGRIGIGRGVWGSALMAPFAPKLREHPASWDTGSPFGWSV